MTNEDDPLYGHHLTVIAKATGMYTARQLAKWDAEVWHHSNRQKIKAGEHLAAICIISFLKCGLPAQIDTDGGVDLTFGAIGSRHLGIRQGVPVAFEVKSLPGHARRFDAMINRGRDRGQELGEMPSIQGVVRPVAEVFDAARPELDAAQRQLSTKTSPDDSRNIFLAVHPFDFLAKEMFEGPFIGQHLPDPEIDDSIDSLWFLLAPDQLVVWSVREASWETLMIADHFDGPPELMSSLQAAEDAFLGGIGITDGSPWLFNVQPRSDSS